MRKAVGAALSLAALSGCATGGDVFRVADGKFRVTTTAITSFGGAGKARSEGIKRANAYCAQQGKVAVVDDATVVSDITQGTSDVTFRCEVG